MIDYVELTKPRITVMVMYTAVVGFVLGVRGALPVVALLAVALGTGLVASGASAFNMLLERHSDGLMRRTRNRPLPAGRLEPRHVGIFGGILTGAGLLLLLLACGPLAAGLALVTWVSYVAVYTPLKSRTPLATFVGAVPGALPPVIGWAAARGSLDAGAGMIFAILFLWQIPHFLAIAWIYRDDYALGGLPMLPVIDAEGNLTGRQALAHSLALFIVSLTPALAGLAGTLYLAGATVLGAVMIVAAARLAVQRSLAAARFLFVASLGYLAGLSGLLLFDRATP